MAPLSRTLRLFVFLVSISVQLILSKAHSQLVLVHTNQVKNEVLVYKANSKGLISLKQRIFTGGVGQPKSYSEPVRDTNITISGHGNDPLGAQGSLIVSGKNVFVVNSGEGTVSWLQFSSKKVLYLVSKSPPVSKSATFFVSLTVSAKRNVVIAVDALGGGYLYAFKYGGKKIALHPDFLGPNTAANFSLKTLGGKIIGFGTSADYFAIVLSAAQVSFSPDEDYLIAVAKSSGLWLFDIVGGKLTIPYNNKVGATPSKPGSPVPKNSIPFGFSTVRISSRLTALYLTSALINADPTRGGSVESYKIAKLYPGKFVVVRISQIKTFINNVASGQCWSFIYKSYLYTTSPAAPSIIAFKIDGRAALSVIQANVVPPQASPKPLDITGTSDGKFLYVVTGSTWNLTTLTSTPSVTTYKVVKGGALSFVGATYLPSLPWPTGVEGIAIY